MFRTHHLVAVIGLPLLLAGCSEDSTPPSGPRAEPTPQPAARVSATAVDRYHFQFRGLATSAVFYSRDPTGCVDYFVFVGGAEETLKEGPGKAITGPLASVEVSTFNFCTSEFRNIWGRTGDATFQVDNKLAEARLQATIAAVDLEKQVEVQVVVDLAWTAVGEPSFSTDRFRGKAPGVMVTEWSKGTYRDAAVSGTVTVEGENIAARGEEGAIRRVKAGRFELVRSR